MKIVKKNDNYIDEAVAILKNGGLVVYPSDTCYGLAADARNSNALDKLFKYKQRDLGKGTSVHLDKKESIGNFIHLNSKTDEFVSKFLPGPYTVVGVSKKVLDQRLESYDSKLGIRYTESQPINTLAKLIEGPLTSTSANQKGLGSPYSVNEILSKGNPELLSYISLIIDGGELPKNPPSTVIDLTKEDSITLRAGAFNPSDFQLLNTYTIKSPEDMVNLGKNLVESGLLSEKYVLLNGDLGAGKTQLTKGLVAALGSNDKVRSPTYNYINEYTVSNKKILHIDSWKLETKEDASQIINFINSSSNIEKIIIEWVTTLVYFDPNFLLKKSYIFIDIRKVDEETRDVSIYLKE